MSGHTGVKRCVVYVLTDPETVEIRYVGKTSYPNPETRRLGHVSRARRVCTTHRDAWIRSLLVSGLEPVLWIIQAGEWTSTELDVAERWWIAELREMCDLTNHTDGGDGGAVDRSCFKKSYPRTEKQINQLKQMHASNRGKKRTPEQRANIREALAIANLRPEVKKRRREWQLGKPKSQSHRDAISRALTGVPMTPERRAENAIGAHDRQVKRWERWRVEGKAKPRIRTTVCAYSQCQTVFTQELNDNLTCSKECQYAYAWEVRRRNKSRVNQYDH